MLALTTLGRLPWRRLAVALGLFFLLDLLWIGVWFPLTTRSRTCPADRLEPIGAPVLVLGAGVTPGKEPSPVLEERLRTALLLFQSGRAPWILVSGDNRSIYYNEPQAMRRWLIRQGVPPTLIVSDYAGRRTYDSLKRAQRVFGLRRVVVVTSRFHMARSLFLARSLGLEAWGAVPPHQTVPLYKRGSYWCREYIARHVAIWDTWFPPATLLGPREPTPEDYGKQP